MKKNRPLKVVKRNGKRLWTQAMLCKFWDCCLRTVQNERKRWKLKPVDAFGLRPLFDPKDVRRADARRLKFRLNQLGLT
jgi:hypothetical protein